MDSSPSIRLLSGKASALSSCWTRSTGVVLKHYDLLELPGEVLKISGAQVAPVTNQIRLIGGAT